VFLDIQTDTQNMQIAIIRTCQGGPLTQFNAARLAVSFARSAHVIARSRRSQIFFPTGEISPSTRASLLSRPVCIILAQSRWWLHYEGNWLKFCCKEPWFCVLYGIYTGLYIVVGLLARMRIAQLQHAIASTLTGYEWHVRQYIAWK